MYKTQEQSIGLSWWLSWIVAIIFSRIHHSESQSYCRKTASYFHIWAGRAVSQTVKALGPVMVVAVVILSFFLSHKRLVFSFPCIQWGRQNWRQFQSLINTVAPAAHPAATDCGEDAVTVWRLSVQSRSNLNARGGGNGRLADFKQTWSAERSPPTDYNITATLFTSMEMP